MSKIINNLMNCFVCCISGITGINGEERHELRAKEKYAQSFKQKWRDNPGSIAEMKNYLTGLEQMVVRGGTTNYYNTKMYQSIVRNKDYIDLAIYICNNFRDVRFVLQQYPDDDGCFGGRKFRPYVVFILDQKLNVEFDILCVRTENIRIKDDGGIKLQSNPDNAIEFVRDCANRYEIHTR